MNQATNFSRLQLDRMNRRIKKLNAAVTASHRHHGAFDLQACPSCEKRMVRDARKLRVQWMTKVG